MRVDVQPFQFVPVFSQGIVEGSLFEASHSAQVLRSSFDHGQVGEHFAHAAVLNAQHALHVIVAQRSCPACHPPSQLLRGLECLRVASQGVHIEMARYNLVNCVERRPYFLLLAEAIEKLDREGA